MDDKLIRRGIVSNVFPERHTVTVTFEDEDEVVSPELPVLVPLASKDNLFCLPDVGESVFCVFEQNDSDTGDGAVIGSYYQEINAPKADSIDKKRVDFEGGSFIEFDRATGNLEINCTGDVIIKGKNIFLN